MTIQVTVVAEAVGDNTNITVTFEKDGAEVYQEIGSQLMDYRSSHTFTYFDPSPGTGMSTYRVWLGNDWHQGGWNNYRSTAIFEITSN